MKEGIGHIQHKFVSSMSNQSQWWHYNLLEMKPVKLVRRGMDEGKKNETKGVTEKEKKKRKKYKKINAQRVPTKSHHLQSCQPKDFQLSVFKRKRRATHGNPPQKDQILKRTVWAVKYVLEKCYMATQQLYKARAFHIYRNKQTRKALCSTYHRFLPKRLSVCLEVLLRYQQG